MTWEWLRLPLQLLCLVSVFISIDQAYDETEDKLLGAHHLLYDPYNGERAPVRWERLYGNLDEHFTELTEAYEPSGKMNEILFNYRCIFFATFVMKQ